MTYWQVRCAWKHMSDHTSHEDGVVYRSPLAAGRASTARTQKLVLPLTAWGFTDTDATGGGGGSSFRRILLAVTGSESSRHAVSLVGALARDRRSEVFVIHYYERVSAGHGCYWDLEARGEADRLVRRVRADLRRCGVSSETWIDKSLADVTTRRIAEAGVACRADLIVIGCPHGKSPAWAVFRGCVSHEILHRSSIPVLVVP